MSYEKMAEVYDFLMQDIAYEEWLEFIKTTIAKERAKTQDILDLGCGTGIITSMLAKEGFNLSGIDNSLDMLVQAEKRFREDGLQIPLYQQDIRDFSVPKKFDVIISTFDTLNYCVAEGDLDLVFSNVYKNLKEDGLFIFDVNTKYYLEEVLGENTFTYNTEDLVYIWENEYLKEEKKLYMDLTFFLKKENNLYEKFVENHLEKAHSQSEIKSFLEKNNLSLLGIYGDFKKSKPSVEDFKNFYITKRN